MKFCTTAMLHTMRLSADIKRLTSLMCYFTYYANFYAMQVDMSKVKLDVLKPWITQKITEILKMEDDVVIDYVNNQLEEKVITQSIFLFLFHIADM